MKALLRRIRIDQSRGLTLAHSQWIQVQGEWTKLFGGPALSFPDVTIYDMISDLEDHYRG
jgi:hypothetical protein